MTITCTSCQTSNPAARRRCYQCGKPLVKGGNTSNHPTTPATIPTARRPSVSIPTSHTRPALSQNERSSSTSRGMDITALRDKLNQYQPSSSASSPISSPVSSPISSPGSHPVSSGVNQDRNEVDPLKEADAQRSPRGHDLRGALRYEQLYQLHLEGERRDRGLFIFQGRNEEGQQRLPLQALSLLTFCSPYQRSSPQEASLSLSLELPPRSWLQTLVDLKPDAHVWVWIDEWPEGKTGSQLSEGYPCTLFYGEEGLRALSVALYRLAPQRAHRELPDDPWWRKIAERAAQEEAEAIRELMRSPQSAPYLIELCANRTQAWAKRSSEISWAQLAQATQAVLNHSSQNTRSSLTPLSQVQRAMEELKRVAAQWAERVMAHELLSIAGHQTTSLKIACLSQLRDELPALTILLENLKAEVTWFKHPQALLNKISVQYFDWAFILDQFHPWDGDDLIGKLKEQFSALRIVCFTQRPSPVRSARAFELSCEALIDLDQGIGAVLVQLIKALDAPQRLGGMKDLLKQLSAIHQAQHTQRLPLAYGLVLLETSNLSSWLPLDLMKLNQLRAHLLPKSLPSISLSNTRIGFCVAEVLLPTLQGFMKQARGLSAQPIAGASLAEGGRTPEIIFTDALGRLEWARSTQQPLSWGHWRGGDAWGSLKAIGSSQQTINRLKGDGEQVLIIDTDPTSADALKFACEQEGLMVNLLSSSKAALDLLRRLPTPPALLIAECAPPQCDGLALLKAALSLPHGQPRVVLTLSVKRSELMREAFEEGAMDVLIKPFQMNEALTRVLYALKRAPLR